MDRSIHGENTRKTLEPLDNSLDGENAAEWITRGKRCKTLCTGKLCRSSFQFAMIAVCFAGLAFLRSRHAAVSYSKQNLEPAAVSTSLWI